MEIDLINNDLIVKIPLGDNVRKNKEILDYLRYLDSVPSKEVNQKEFDELISEVKKGRWERIKKEIDF